MFKVCTSLEKTRHAHNCTIYSSTQAYDNVQNQDNVQLSRQLGNSQLSICIVQQSLSTIISQVLIRNSLCTKCLCVYDSQFMYQFAAVFTQQSFRKCLCVDATMGVALYQMMAVCQRIYAVCQHVTLIIIR